jgi:hypothetical protein
MTEFIDPFPTLPKVVDIGGERYFMGPEKPIELGFKSRQDFLNSFGKQRDTERILRQYMYYELGSKKRLQFDSPDDRAALIKILKTRAQQLEASKEFTSSTLKNTLIQRSYLNIQRLIQQLEGPEYKGFELPKIPDLLPCTKAKTYIKQIPEDRLFQMILEIAWYLLHPEKVPSKVQCDWAKLVKQLDTLRLGDVVSEIHQLEQAKGQKPSEKALNYFKKINLETVAKKESLSNALEEAAKMATQIQAENAEADIKERLKTLLSILEIKKYLSNTLQVDKDRLKIVDAQAAEKIKKDMIRNPMQGGAAKALDKPLAAAMNPLYDYFKVVFDPIYSLLDSSIQTYSANSTKTKKIIIPQLTTLMHICSNLNPSETATGGANTYGVYRIKNADPEVIEFINTMMISTQTYVEKFQDDKTKNQFNKQLFELPKVRLTSLLNRFLDSTTYKDPDTIPYIQFFTVGGNLLLKEKTDFLTPKMPELTEQVFNATTDFFTANDVYIVCTKTENIKEDIPMNVYEIDYTQVDVGETGLQINNIPDNYFNKNKTPPLFMDKLVTTKPYIVFNDAELALSILISFKDLMPK